jgi:hypothetical protein
MGARRPAVADGVQVPLLPMPTLLPPALENLPPPDPSPFAHQPTHVVPPKQKARTSTRGVAMPVIFCS